MTFWRHFQEQGQYERVLRSPGGSFTSPTGGNLVGVSAATHAFFLALSRAEKHELEQLYRDERFLQTVFFQHLNNTQPSEIQKVCLEYPVKYWNPISRSGRPCCVDIVIKTCFYHGSSYPEYPVKPWFLLEIKTMKSPKDAFEKDLMRLALSIANQVGEIHGRYRGGFFAVFGWGDLSLFPPTGFYSFSEEAKDACKSKYGTAPVNCELMVAFCGSTRSGFSLVLYRVIPPLDFDPPIVAPFQFLLTEASEADNEGDVVDHFEPPF